MNSESNARLGGFFLCEPCLFDDVFAIWRRELWPGRKSPIESNSAMKWLGGIDMSLMSATPSFWRVTDTSVSENSPTVGVLSGHFGGVIDGARAYRTRGLWVASNVRKKGIARLLMDTAFKQARFENCVGAWTFPRESSMAFYQAVGFKRVGSWIGVNDPLAGEFGPNCYALASLASERR